MIGKTALHAIKALATLARTGNREYAGAATLATSVGAPRNYLGKLLQTLARAGLVEGRKGLNGGFRLARPAETISLYDVVEPIEPTDKWRGCFMTRSSCDSHNPCQVHRRWTSVRDTYIGFLKETSIRDLTKSGGVKTVGVAQGLPHSRVAGRPLGIPRAGHPLGGARKPWPPRV